ncbi:MAG TPA: SDR family oxidoreductase [Ktedonobacteraceae bacterium]|nr:SDR family oxidoreductase [Ktedonobacteraceae bacterium]
MALTSFEGAVAVVTGGASGIGLATAKKLYRRGAHVVLADINGAALGQAEAQVSDSASTATNQVIGMLTNVTDEAQVAALMQRTVQEFGRVDLVMCSAGIGGAGVIDTFSGTEMERMMNINFMGTYHCVRAALPAMRQQHAGHFVFMSSMAGKLCVPLLTAYCATKWAVRGFSAALRAELYGTDIGVTTVYPSWVDTPMVQREQAGAELLTIEVLLTADQVADEILQAVIASKTDLTLAPDAGSSFLLKVMHDDPDKAEQLAGAGFQERLAEFMRKQASS